MGHAPSLTYRIKYAVHNKTRHRDLAAWRRAWIVAWGWVFDTLWTRWLYPHLRPRTYADKEFAVRLELRVPPRIDGYVWRDESGVFVGELRQRDGGPWGVCCFEGATKEMCESEMLKYVAWCAELAGAQVGCYTVMWHEGRRDKSSAWTAWM